MKIIIKILLGVLITLPLAPAFAQTDTERELRQLQADHDKALDAALRAAREKTNQRYQASLEKLLDHATQEADFDTASKIRTTLDTLPSVVAKQLAGVWALRADTGYAATVTFQSGGTGAHSEYGQFQWRIEGTTLYLGQHNTADKFQLPIRNGNLKGVNSIGNELTLTQR